MVGANIFAIVLSSGKLFAQTAEQKIPEPMRTIVLMALLGIMLVGMMLIVGTMLGAHWVRRQGRVHRGPVVPQDVISPRGKTSSRSAINPPADAGSAETFVGDDTVRNDDTVVG